MAGDFSGGGAGDGSGSFCFWEWDRNLGGFFRLTSIRSWFPVSIAFPRWGGDPIADVSPDGFGVVTIPNAFVIHREPLAGGTSPEALRDQALAGFDARQRDAATANRLLGTRYPVVGKRRLDGDQTPIAIGQSTLRLSAERIVWDGGEEFFFAAPPHLPSFWRVSVWHRDVGPDDMREVLQSLTWLDANWFRAIVAL